MRYKVGDLVTWDGHEARIGAIMEHPSRYIIEYTVRQSDVSGTITHSFGRTKIVKEDDLTPSSELAPDISNLTVLKMAFQDCESKEQAVRTAWDGTVKSVGMPNKVQKNMLSAFKVAEQEYIKALRKLHEAAKAVQL